MDDLPIIHFDCLRQFSYYLFAYKNAVMSNNKDRVLLMDRNLIVTSSF
jgi:hypothetical protein